MMAMLTVKLSIKKKKKKSIENVLFRIYLLSIVYCITHMFKNHILEKSSVFFSEKRNLVFFCYYAQPKKKKEKKNETNERKNGNIDFFLFFSLFHSCHSSVCNRARMFSPYDTKCTKEK